MSCEKGGDPDEGDDALGDEEGEEKKEIKGRGPKTVKS